jgi:4-oxalocrotonate tautomerase
MPFVTVRITREGATREQKGRVIAGVTALLQRELGKDPATTHVIIEEVDLDNWGLAGLAVPAFRQQLQAAEQRAHTVEEARE